jgi:hypothetical protein
MKSMTKIFAKIGIATLLVTGATNISAQERPGGRGGGNFDPAEMRQRMMEMYKERLEVTSADEWKVIEPRIEKVTEARRETTRGGIGGGFGAFGRGGRGGGGDNQGGDNQGRRGGGGGGRGGFGGGEPSPELDALQKALEAKAPAEEIKAKLAKVREAQQQKQAKLEQAQEDLRKVLSVRQEANAVILGLLR